MVGSCPLNVSSSNIASRRVNQFDRRLTSVERRTGAGRYSPASTRRNRESRLRTTSIAMDFHDVVQQEQPLFHDHFIQLSTCDSEFGARNVAALAP